MFKFWDKTDMNHCYFNYQSIIGLHKNTNKSKMTLHNSDTYLCISVDKQG